MTSPTCVLHPQQFAGSTCPRCGNFTCVTCNPDGQTNCPTCRALTADAARGLVPWERRDELGLASAFWQQLKQTLFEPTRFWATVDRTRPAGEAFWFAWLVQVVACLGALPYQAFNFWLQGGQLRQMEQTFGNAPGPMQAFVDIFGWLVRHPLLASAAVTAYAIVVFPLSFFFTTGLAHLGCIIAGMRNHPLSVTVRALGYASAANISLVIPVVGGFGSIYTLVLQIWGLRELQQGTTGKAIFAVLWWVLVFGCCAMTAAVAAGFLIASKASRY